MTVEDLKSLAVNPVAVLRWHRRTQMLPVALPFWPRAHRLVAAAARCLYAVALVLGVMCACMSVLAAAVRAAICLWAQATAATAVPAALAAR